MSCRLFLGQVVAWQLIPQQKTIFCFHKQNQKQILALNVRGCSPWIGSGVLLPSVSSIGERKLSQHNGRQIKENQHWWESQDISPGAWLIFEIFQQLVWTLWVWQVNLFLLLLPEPTNAGARSLMCHLPVEAYKLPFIFSCLAHSHSPLTALLQLSAQCFLLLLHLVSPFGALCTKSACWLIKFDKHS